MIAIILSFVSNNWDAFVIHCKSHGIDNVEEIEKELEALEDQRR